MSDALTNAEWHALLDSISEYDSARSIPESPPSESVHTFYRADGRMVTISDPPTPEDLLAMAGHIPHLTRECRARAIPIVQRHRLMAEHRLSDDALVAALVTAVARDEDVTEIEAELLRRLGRVS